MSSALTQERDSHEDIKASLLFDQALTSFLETDQKNINPHPAVDVAKTIAVGF